VPDEHEVPFAHARQLRCRLALEIGNIGMLWTMPYAGLKTTDQLTATVRRPLRISRNSRKDEPAVRRKR
jgi:hypothetical protein